MLLGKVKYAKQLEPQAAIVGPNRHKDFYAKFYSVTLMLVSYLCIATAALGHTTPTATTTTDPPTNPPTTTEHQSHNRIHS